MVITELGHNGVPAAMTAVKQSGDKIMKSINALCILPLVIATVLWGGPESRAQHISYRTPVGLHEGQLPPTITFTAFDGSTYVSPDGGYGWRIMSRGVSMDSTSYFATHRPHSRVTFTSLDGSTHVSTDGARSFWRPQVSPSAVAPQLQLQKLSAEVLSVLPNPTTGRTEVRYEVLTAQFVHLSIQDVNGRDLIVLQDGNLVPGTYTATFNASRWRSGVYSYRLAGDKIVSSGSIVVKH